ncbi:putative 3-hydroxyacyl-CoA dehydrogenase [Exophiala viscosa]|uniref:3-hydroxyacyl-CoA dehydrogenase n=1 Tax=Exophiala viscosa TaxID=2486360 RepID=A0AAN6DRB3_9EURO|nr:putative 3-hydroxyacyl-CoA dehydrogenase [Exophiala viscosa]
MSNSFNPSDSKFGELKDKVVVLTGGANGIGASVVKAVHSNGGKVVFGDYDVKSGESLASSLGSDVTFLKVNVADYADHVKLFKLAREKYGHVDHALAIAGVAKKDNWYGTDLTVEDVEDPEQDMTIDVNLLGVLYFIRVALPYLKLDNKDRTDKSLVLAGSAAGFRETPDLPVYNASKHAVQGIMRGLRKKLWENDKIRINVINPGVVDTNMASTLATTFRKAGLPINTPEDVAAITLRLMTETDMWGKSVYIDGGSGWEWETGYHDTMSTWLGEEPVQRLKDGMKLIASSKAWDSHHAKPSTT